MITRLTVRDTFTGPALPLAMARRELAEVHQAVGLREFLTEGLNLAQPEEKQTAPASVERAPGAGEGFCRTPADYSAAGSALQALLAGEQ